jgi:hypothetical protein
METLQKDAIKYLETVRAEADKIFSEEVTRTNYLRMSSPELQTEIKLLEVTILGRAFENFSGALSLDLPKTRRGRESPDLNYTRDVLSEIDLKRLVILEEICAERKL